MIKMFNLGICTIFLALLSCAPPKDSPPGGSGGSQVKIYDTETFFTLSSGTWANHAVDGEPQIVSFTLEASTGKAIYRTRAQVIKGDECYTVETLESFDRIKFRRMDEIRLNAMSWKNATMHDCSDQIKTDLKATSAVEISEANFFKVLKRQTKLLASLDSREDWHKAKKAVPSPIIFGSNTVSFNHESPYGYVYPVFSTIDFQIVGIAFAHVHAETQKHLPLKLINFSWDNLFTFLWFFDGDSSWTTFQERSMIDCIHGIRGRTLEGLKKETTNYLAFLEEIRMEQAEGGPFRTQCIENTRRLLQMKTEPDKK